MKKYQIILADPPWSYNDMKGNDPKMGGITYPSIELFARKEDSLFEHKDWEGWDIWGNEVKNDIEL